MIGHNYYTHITTNPQKTTLYIGVTNNLSKGLSEHFDNAGRPETFAGRYYCYNLVYYELTYDIKVAIAREKEIKKWRREKKDALIATLNPEWKFLNGEV